MYIDGQYQPSFYEFWNGYFTKDIKSRPKKGD